MAPGSAHGAERPSPPAGASEFPGPECPARGGGKRPPVGGWTRGDGGGRVGCAASAGGAPQVQEHGDERDPHHQRVRSGPVRVVADRRVGGPSLHVRVVLRAAVERIARRAGSDLRVRLARLERSHLHRRGRLVQREPLRHDRLQWLVLGRRDRPHAERVNPGVAPSGRPTRLDAVRQQRRWLRGPRRVPPARARRGVRARREQSPVVPPLFLALSLYDPCGE